MQDVYVSDPDHQVGKILKRLKPNPTGENIYLDEDGVTIHKDEDKIKKAQRIFKHNYYKPGGRGALKVLRRLLEANASSVVADDGVDVNVLLDSHVRHAHQTIPTPALGVDAMNSHTATAIE